MHLVHVAVVAGSVSAWLLAGCGGTVVFDEEGGSADGGGGAASHVVATAGPSGGPAATSGGPSPSATANSASSTSASSTSASSTGAGGAPVDGSCVATDYCSCVAASPTCRVIAEDCFCTCDEPCSEPCECDCAGGAFLMCAPDTIEDPGALEVGLWLIGEANGGNHFSWLRFDAGGVLLVLDGRDLPENQPWFSCSGTGSWSLEGNEAVQLDLPGGCDTTSLTFGDWYPIGAFDVDTPQEVFLFDSGKGVTLGAWRFPDDWCSPDFTTCADPFTP